METVNKLFGLFHLLHGAVHFHHIAGKDFKIHILPAIDFIPGFRFVIHNGLPFSIIGGLAGIMEI